MNDISMNQSHCQGCSLPIKDQYIFKVLPDMQWHEHCLKCAECSCMLSDTCFVRGSKAYCRADYMKLFIPTARSCDKCGLTLNRNDLIMKSRDKIFHMDCFKCSICYRKLAPGDEYCHQPLNDMILCKEDALLGNSSPKFLMSNNNGNQLYLSTNRYPTSTMSITPENSSSSSCSFSPSTNSSSASSIIDSPSNYLNTSFQSNQNNYSNVMDQTNLNRNQFEFDSYQDKEDSEEEDDNLIDDDNDESITDEDSSFTESKSSRNKKSAQKLNNNKKQKNNYTSSPDTLLLQINSNYNTGSSHGSKPARIRTVLNEKQLHTLRACYVANPRPDALMKEQLVEMTGLNPRVIRVWFQNKRCKDKKKNMLRPEHHHLGNPMTHHLNVQNHQFNSNTNQHLMFEHCF